MSISHVNNITSLNCSSTTHSKMQEQLILRADHVMAPQEVGFVPKASSSSHVTDTNEDEECNVSSDEEDGPLIQPIECRICQEEDSVKNLQVPCACSGSLKFAHRKCVQRWCDEKRDVICEICHQPYKPGYTVLPRQSDDTIIDISGNWTISGTPLDLNDPRVLAMAAAERRLIESDYDEYEDNSASGASLCRSVAIILMALLLLRHALTIGDGDSDDDDPSVFFALFLIRAAGFLLPCYIMIWAISLLQRRRQAQEVETLAAADVAFMIHSGQHRGLQVTIAPGTAMAPSPTGYSHTTRNPV
ncbi:hypothetical protein QVD17_38922 [Tagetes erecta]|uniref:RING-CH-type domain-containing protein n=1 Tax=Tagetes erecta TaxID=13708 RepID=A0AAD8JPR7_TARER|nr:hypothetical protein QVD17_38922 [Tagetes erecta]